MPGVRLHRAAAELLRGSGDFAKERLFHHDDQHEHPEGERRGRVMRDDDLAYALHGQTDGGGDDREGHGDGGQRLGFAVAVRMLFVRRLCGDFQAKPDGERAEDIERGLDAVGDERVAMAEDARDDFDEREEEIYGHADQSQPRDGAVAASAAGGGFARDDWFCGIDQGAAS